jgi:hypothetical protein
MNAIDKVTLFKEMSPYDQRIVLLREYKRQISFEVLRELLDHTETAIRFFSRQLMLEYFSEKLVPELLIEISKSDYADIKHFSEKLLATKTPDLKEHYGELYVV